jgi:hypothetical protein
MRIRRMVIVIMVTLLVVLALAGPASAGGRVEAALPGWLETAIVVTLLVVGVIYVLVVAFGIAYRRRHQ